MVSRENLGTVPGLLAGAALLLDYILAAALSLTAGVAALGSAFPALWPYRVPPSLLLPEFVPARWWHGLLHNQTAWLIKTALLYRRRRPCYQRAVLDVPHHLAR